MQIDDKLGRTWLIGVGVTGTPRRWPCQATDVRGVRGGAPQVQLDRRGRHRRAASVARFTPRMCGACAGERSKFDSIGVGVTGTLRRWPFQATDVRGVRGIDSAIQRRLGTVSASAIGRIEDYKQLWGSGAAWGTCHIGSALSSAFVTKQDDDIRRL